MPTSFGARLLRVIVRVRHNRCALAALLAVALLAGSSRPAQATSITMVFTGTIDVVDPGLESAFAIGDGLTATLTFDSEAASDLSVSTWLGIYNTSITSFGVTTTGGYSASASVGQISVRNEPGSDWFRAVALSGGTQAGAGSGFDLTGADVNGYDLLAFAIILSDPTGTAFTSDSLPSTLDLSKFASQQIAFNFGVGDYGATPGPYNRGYLGVGALSIETLVIQEGSTTGGGSTSGGGTTDPGTGPVPVPEPASITLLASGLAAVLARARQRRPTRR